MNSWLIAQAIAKKGNNAYAAVDITNAVIKVADDIYDLVEVSRDLNS